LRPIEVIPNFVNCDEYKPLGDLRAAARARYAAPGEKILLHLSNFRPVKRILDAIEVFGRVAQEIPARLLLVGDGPDRSSAEWLASSKGIQDRVHFLGKQDRVHELLPVADLMVMPSELESFGLAALEAMACKVPSISTRVGGVSELIEDGVTGRLFAVGDVDAMAAAAIELLNDDARLAAMANAGRRAAQDRYCASRIIPVYEEYYERVLARAEV
jgi:N-acetyl-alpha-D-glucosaminyl L-malate synthase BshA